ncbi:16S rRNA (uracil(1498)-N(3))-methyltransferase [Desulfogranum mediterraneum]|uniref:16S rRNA (uracil(1498)-N(3))-methyltransferase n=1 Tax=Desulfogranum mediterraneum TaxID=160661 RepID=UPI00042363FF|nr:16S rRNA (uracil(1498)-N(3))-methyltransferase [Desulfogranum mediterraneum]
MRRFFLSPEMIEDNTIRLKGTEARHMAKVLRLQPGDQVEFFDGSGLIYLATLERVDWDSVIAALEQTRTEQAQNKAPLTLILGLLKGKKMDLVIQKATELGIERCIPVHSRYCENFRHQERQRERWQRIMIEACKQCRRTTPMTIDPVSDLADLELEGYRHRLLAWEAEQAQVLPRDLTAQPGPVCLCIGPEGGWHPQEVEQLTRAGCRPFSLGPRILRGETAAIAGMAIIQYLSGALSPRQPPPA